MDGIAISVTQLIIKGIPEGFLMMLALHILTGTKIDAKKYFLLSSVYVILTYLIRFLPITLGVNTMISLLTMILLFQLTYKTQLGKVVKSVVSAVLIMTFVMISEILNMLILYTIYGQSKAEELLNFGSELTQSLVTIPSSIFLALFIVLSHVILTRLEKRKNEHGEANKKTGG
ncbi:MAG: hypothetical protein LLG09_02285 [Negativicutes bacterium]|nr:hypothetical protein [Negativicutes bacterium]